MRIFIIWIVLIFSATVTDALIHCNYCEMRNNAVKIKTKGPYGPYIYPPEFIGMPSVEECAMCFY